LTQIEINLRSNPNAPRGAKSTTEKDDVDDDDKNDDDDDARLLFRAARPVSPRVRIETGTNYSHARKR
jgi:hypothetical protein